MNEVQVRSATRNDREVAATSLASAFATDPIFLWIRGSTDPIGPNLVHLFDALMYADTRKDDHLAFVTDDGRGVAIWHDVDEWRMPIWQLLPALPAFLRAFGTGLLRAWRLEEAMERDHPPEPHYYLGVLGTHKDAQGQGLGSALMQPMVERCDTEGMPAYLENSNPANTPFYARHGFVDRGLVELPAGAPPLQAMWRDPR